jgi:hypothetical protein
VAIHTPHLAFQNSPNTYYHVSLLGDDNIFLPIKVFPFVVITRLGTKKQKLLAQISYTK